MAFSVMASSSSALSSRVANNNNSALRKQTVSRKSASAFSCRAMSEAEIDAKYPVGGSVYKVRLSSSSSSFLFFSAHTSLKTMRLKIDIAKERERERVSRQTIIFGKHIHALELDREKFFSKKLVFRFAFFLVSLSSNLTHTHTLTDCYILF
jgi:hypothetical protein